MNLERATARKGANDGSATVRNVLVRLAKAAEYAVEAVPCQWLRAGATNGTILDGIRPVARSGLCRLLSQLAKDERLLDGAGECRRPLERALEPGHSLYRPPLRGGSVHALPLSQQGPGGCEP